MDTDDPALDIASSLRAAALLSRKRRRVEALPPRLAPEPTMQLDYGNDHPAAAQSDTEPTEHIQDIEDGQVREEGEISDTETSPPPRRSPTPGPPPRLRQRPFASQPQESARAELPLPPRPPSSEAPIASPLEPSDAQPWESASLEPLVLETSTYRLDANHVRPGLSSSSSLLHCSPHRSFFSSDPKSIQHRQRNCSRPPWMGRSSRISLGVRLEPTCHLLHFFRTQSAASSQFGYKWAHSVPNT